jgi:hypothetical protein
MGTMGRAAVKDRLAGMGTLGRGRVSFLFIFLFSFLFIFFSHFRFRILNLNSVVNLHIYQVFQFKPCDKNIYLYIYSLFLFFIISHFQIFKLVINSQLWI